MLPKVQQFHAVRRVPCRNVVESATFRGFGALESGNCCTEYNISRITRRFGAEMLHQMQHFDFGLLH